MSDKKPVLVIVESPTKAKTISQILGNKYLVEASMGHLRDLPKATLGVDTEDQFKPQYVIPTKSRKNVTKLKKLYEKSQELILATDEDREGEAIGWHITEALNIPAEGIKRIVFHEITEEAIKESIENPRKIDFNLVNAQQARRVLDRLVGYKLSPLLWKKIFRGLSAGRVQSVAVRIIVEREREREKFKSEEYWKILVEYKVGNDVIEAELIKIDDKALNVTKEAEAKKVAEELKKDVSEVLDIKNVQRIRKPSAPLTTSTLQQQAGTKLGYSVKKTMTIAQQLYEGVKLGTKGQVGLITYMRTDSYYISPKAIESARDWIKSNFGADYIPETARVYKTKKKGAQEAHEAIRPASLENNPEEIKEFLSSDQFRLYKIIWERTLASQMTDALIDRIDLNIKSNNKLLLASGVKVKFLGFLKIYTKMPIAEKTLPSIEINQKLDVKVVDTQQKFTEPPARFSEPTLVKTLEGLGIGRPSTYAPTIATIIGRGYVRREAKQLVPQEVGYLVNDFLVEHFPEIVNAEFTANMEDKLDKIADGEIKYIDVLQDFYPPFAEKLAQKEESVSKKDLDETTDEVCDKCKKPMIIKMGRFGKFLACSGFPECKNTKNLNNAVAVMDCPKCKDGKVVVKRTKRGKIFWGCNAYPDCEFASWNEPIKDKCPTCKGLMTLIGKDKIPTCIECGFADKEIKT